MNVVEDFESSVLYDTYFPVEEFNLTWRICNFSQVFGKVDIDFFTNSSTKKKKKWTFSLHKTIITLIRESEEDVKVQIKYSLVTRHKEFQGERDLVFSGNNRSFDIINFYLNETIIINGKYETRSVPLEFENDVFKFHCQMKFTGPAVTQFLKSNDCLKPNFEKLSNDFKKLLNSKEHCDFTISTGNKTLPVHKSVLCARSVVIDKMFKKDMFENKNQLLKLDDFDYDTVENFINFLYTGDVKIVSVEKAMALYHIADKYEVGDLCEKCSLYLKNKITISEACTVLKFSELHKDSKLKSAVELFIQIHTSEVKLTDGWKQLVKDNPKLALEVLK